MVYNELTKNNLDALLGEIAEYTRLSEEVAAARDGLRDTLKAYMTKNGLDTVTGSEHKASYKQVTSTRIDSKALKAARPEIYEQFSKQTTAFRLTFD